MKTWGIYFRLVVNQKWTFHLYYLIPTVHKVAGDIGGTEKQSVIKRKSDSDRYSVLPDPIQMVNEVAKITKLVTIYLNIHRIRKGYICKDGFINPSHTSSVASKEQKVVLVADYSGKSWMVFDELNTMEDIRLRRSIEWSEKANSKHWPLHQGTRYNSWVCENTGASRMRYHMVAKRMGMETKSAKKNKLITLWRAMARPIFEQLIMENSPATNGWEFATPVLAVPTSW